MEWRLYKQIRNVHTTVSLFPMQRKKNNWRKTTNNPGSLLSNAWTFGLVSSLFVQCLSWSRSFAKPSYTKALYFMALKVHMKVKTSHTFFCFVLWDKCTHLVSTGSFLARVLGGKKCISYLYLYSFRTDERFSQNNLFVFSYIPAVYLYHTRIWW